MPSKSLCFGNSVIAIDTPNPLTSDSETEPFLVAASDRSLDFRFVFETAEQITEPSNRELLCQNGKWRILRHNGRELRFAYDPTWTVCWAKNEPISDGLIRITCLPDVMEQLALDRVTLSLLALERELLTRDAMIFHAAYLDIGGKALLFSGPSGIGKSTQAALWQQHAGSELINGDRALLQFSGESILACGWPMCGSSQVSKERRLPIAAIVLLEQGQANELLPIRPAQALPRLLAQLTLNRWDKSLYQHAIDLTLRLLSEVPVFAYSCNISAQAVRTLQAHLEAL